VQASIRGAQAREEGAHVTFTHETWTHIHGEMDQRYSDLEIVGWYHTHPGFGIFLSDMDAFIHRNFFGQPAQVALVHDPLAGQIGFFTERNGELAQLTRFWRDGRAVELGSNSKGHDDRGSAASFEAVQAEVRVLRESIDVLRRTQEAAKERSRMDDWLLPAILVLVGLLVLNAVWPIVPTATSVQLDPRDRVVLERLSLAIDYLARPPRTGPAERAPQPQLQPPGPDDHGN
jgi:proteasome lid subunit RPN8/RPN11